MSISKALFMLYIPEALKQTIMASTSTWVIPGKGYTKFAYLFRCNFKNSAVLLCIPEVLRHKIMPGHQPGWTRKDTQHLPSLPCAIEKKYIPMLWKDIQNLPIFSGATLKILLFCYVSQKHSGIKSCQDINLDEPERIHNICLAYHVQLKKNLFMLCIPEVLRHKIMPGHQPGWTRKDSQHLPSLPCAIEKKSFHVMYPRSTQA